MVEEISDSFSIVPEISLMALTESWVAAWMPLICCADLAGGLRGLLGQRLHFGGDHRKAAAGFTGARRLDGGVQREQVGLAGDGVDQLDDVADAGGRLRQLADALGRAARLADGIARHPRRFLHLAADLVDRGRQLFGGGSDRLDVGGGFLRSRRHRRRQLLRTLRRVVDSVPAEASSCVEAEETLLTISPIICSNSRVMLSTRRPRSILASASFAAASSAAFLAISASLNTCSASAIRPISVFSPRCGISTERSPWPSACIGFTIEEMPFETSRTR